MINKKNVLGKIPDELGIKDAIHTAIVAVRAGEVLSPGQKCIINEYGEAVGGSRDAVGVADPWWKKDYIVVGDVFWLLLNQDEVPNVKHVWEHEKFTFEPPTREVVYNIYLKKYADELGVTYKQLMDACESYVKSYKQVKYPGTLSAEEFEEAQENVEYYDLWSEWSGATGHEFENQGTACCPEYDYPRDRLFYWRNR